MTFRNNCNVSSAIRFSQRLLTNDEPRPRSRSKFAGSEKPKVGHKGFGEEGRLQPAGDISRRTSGLQTALSAVTSSNRRRLRRRRRRRFGSTQGRVGYLCKTAEA